MYYILLLLILTANINNVDSHDANLEKDDEVDNTDWTYEHLENNIQLSNINVRFNKENDGSYNCESGDQHEKLNGTFNRPTKTPQCIYDFHRIATKKHEYELFAYCAKGFFFGGLDYNDTDKIKKKVGKTMLFLAEGKMICSYSGKLTTDEEMLANGFTISLVECGGNTLSTYHAKHDQDGLFFLAGIVGKDVADSCISSEGRSNLKLVVKHFCTQRGMLAELNFDVSIGQQQVPDEMIYEDTNLEIYLAEETMKRTTGQILNSTNPK